MDDSFTTPVVVSAETANGATPMFAVDSDGSRVLSWVAPAPDSQYVMNVVVERPGMEPVRSALRDPLGSIEPHGEAPPQVAIVDGAVYALYTVGRDAGGRFPQSALRFARSSDGGATWSDPVSVNEGEAFGSHNFHALFVNRSGTVLAAWLSSAMGNSGVWFRSSSDAGEHWSESRPIHDAPTCPCCRTGVTSAPDGAIHVSWRKIYEGDVRDVVVMTSHDGGRSWDEPVKPRDDGWVFPGCPHAGPSLRTDGSGAVHIAWWTGREGAAGIWYAKSVDQGATWTAQPIDTAGRSAPASVQMALDDNGRIVIVWDDGKSSSPTILLRASGDGGRNFAATRRVSPPGGAATTPVLALHGDSVVVAWTHSADSAYRAAIAARPDMSAPGARMSLPRVGQQEVWARTAAVADLMDHD